MHLGPSRGFFGSRTHRTPGDAFLAVRKTCEFVTRLYISYSSAQLIFTHVYFMDLRSRCAFARRIEGAMLAGVRKLLDLEDLQFPVLLDKRENTGAIGGKRSAVGRARNSGLCHG